MFKLQNLRHHRHIKWPIYLMFGFVIISFVFFYGWNQSGKGKGGPDMSRNFAKMRSDSLNPLSRWEYLDSSSMHIGRIDAKIEKYAVMPQMPQQLQQMIDQRGIMERLVEGDMENVARVAADSDLMRRTAQDMKVQVTTNEVIEGFKRNPGITDDMLNQQAHMLGLGDEYGFVEFRRRHEEEMRVRSIKQLVAHASLFELWQEYSLSNEKLVLRMAAYPADKFESKVTVTQADLDKYLKEHQDEFHVTAKRRYAYVAFNKNESLFKIEPTKEQLQAYYEKNQAKYMNPDATHMIEIYSPALENQVSTQALKILSDLRPQVAKVTDFTSLSLKLNRENKGVDFLSRDRWVEDTDEDFTPQFKGKIRTMAADKGTTIVLDANATHLVRVLDYRKAAVPPLDEIRNKVISNYREEEIEKQFKEQAERFVTERKKMREDKTTTQSVRALAQRMKIKDELTTAVNASDATFPKLGSFDKDRAYITALVPGELSDVVQNDESVAVLQLVSETPEYDPKMAEVKDKVEKSYRKSQSGKLAEQAARQSLNAVKSGADFNKTLADAPKPPFDSGEFTRLESVTGLSAPLIDFRQQTLHINTGSLGLSAYGSTADKPLGYAVWRVEKLLPPKQEEFTKERQKLEAEYLQMQRESISREWLADKRKEAQYHYLTAEERK